KAEFLHQYYKKHGLPWRNWAFGNPGRFKSIVFNWLIRRKSARWLNEKLMGIDRRRAPPAIHSWNDFVWQWTAREDYWFPPGVKPEGNDVQWFDQWQEANGFPEDKRPSILIFPDTITHLYEPTIGLAAAGLFPLPDWRVATILPKGFASSISLREEQPVG